MKRWAKTVKIVVIVFAALLVLSPVIWFVDTRFCLDRYSISMDWQTIAFKDGTYVPKNEQYKSEDEVQAALQYIYDHTGKTIGIAVFPKRTFTDLIWPVWVSEFDGDTAHRQIVVRGLMDTPHIYVKS